VRLPPILAAALCLPLPAWAGCLIALDVGHYRDAPGETSARGVPELEFNRALAGRIGDELGAQGIAHVTVNADGTLAELAERPRRAAKAGASLLLSIHHDSVQDSYKSAWTWDGAERRHSERFSGFGLFVSGLNPGMAESVRVASAIADGLLDAGLRPSLHHAEPIDGENRPLLDAARGLYRYDGLAVLRQAPMPAVLIEAGIVVNRDDEPAIASESYRGRVARAVAQAARAHCARLD
jgi:N-acetylmuramoyl-L-alanine amidase